MDCKVEAGFDNANHQDELMRALIQNADALAGLGDLIQHERVYSIDVQINTSWIPLPFFVEHKDHALRAIDEYGCLDAPCTESFFCPKCQKQVACESRDHSLRPGTKHIHYVAHIGHWES
jgi:hypothetical protein